MHELTQPSTSTSTTKPNPPPLSSLTDPTQRHTLAATSSSANPNAPAPSQTSSGQSRRQRSERSRGEGGGGSGGGADDLAGKIAALQRRQAAGSRTRDRDATRKNPSAPSQSSTTLTTTPNPTTGGGGGGGTTNTNTMGPPPPPLPSINHRSNKTIPVSPGGYRDLDQGRDRDRDRDRRRTESPHAMSGGGGGGGGARGMQGDDGWGPQMTGTGMAGSGDNWDDYGGGGGAGGPSSSRGGSTTPGVAARGRGNRDRINNNNNNGNGMNNERGGRGLGNNRTWDGSSSSSFVGPRAGGNGSGVGQGRGGQHSASMANLDLDSRNEDDIGSDEGGMGRGEYSRGGGGGVRGRGGGGGGGGGWALFDGYGAGGGTGGRSRGAFEQRRRMATGTEEEEDEEGGWGNGNGRDSRGSGAQGAGNGQQQGGRGTYDRRMGNEHGPETTDRIRRDVERLYRPGQQIQGRQQQPPPPQPPQPPRSPTQSNLQPHAYQGQGPMRKLFDPMRHDPVGFGRAMSTSTGSGSNTTRETGMSGVSGVFSSRNGGSVTSTGMLGDPNSRALRKGSSLATSISLDSHGHGQGHGPKEDFGGSGNIPGPNHPNGSILPPHSISGTGIGRTSMRGNGMDMEDDVEGDQQRERRRRREGSERGSQQKSKRDDEGRSRGSRSSEGSESLKDRERGRGKSDPGIMPRLREAYKFIQGLEGSLTEMHRKMSADPSNGVRVLLNAGLLGQSQTVANAQIFNPTMGQGAIGVLRQAEDDEDEYDRRMPAVAKAQPQNDVSDSDREDEAWVELIARHKRLTDAHHDFLSLCLDPLVPASIHGLPVRYNIPARLWQVGFHLLLERMRYTWIANAPSNQTETQHAFSANSRIAGVLSQKDTKMSQRVLEHLTDFIYDAYSFYTNLLEEQVLSNFKTAWIEALGDLARYRMAVASQVAANESQETTFSATFEEPGARIDDVEAEAPPVPSGASIGAEVADSWNLEERETWRTTARDWYVMGLTEKPGEGRLHHHLALLCRDVKGEEVRGLYHFAKSLATSHPFQASRESILPLFDNALQKRRAAPEANASELFVLLHGMLFTRIELDNFDAVFERYMERLVEDSRMAEDGHGSYGRKPISQTQWLLMAIVNLSALMQYGAEDGFVRKALAEDSVARKVNKQAQAGAPQPIILQSNPKAGNQEDSPVEGQNGEGKSSEEDPETPVVSVLKNLTIGPAHHADDLHAYPLHFQKAIQLCFSVLEFCLRHPVRHVGLHVVLNPYITVFLTFLGTAMKQGAVHALLERYIPWTALIDFYNTIPRKIEVRPDVSPKLMGGPPVPEDWCVRGMEWVGRRVYERGFWKTKSSSGGPRGSSGPAQPKSGPRINSEMDVLLGEQDITQLDALEGVVDDADAAENVDAPSAITQRRWKRVSWAGGSLVTCTPGLFWSAANSRKLQIVPEGELDLKVKRWISEDQAKVQEEIKRQRREEEARGEWVDDATIDEIEPPESEDEDDETIDPELRELRARRRYLKSLLTGPKPQAAIATATRKPLSPKPAQQSVSRQAPRPKKNASKLSVLPGYTVLVFDTNVLLSSMELFEKLTESRKWTVVVPLPVITELDGLAKQPGPLGTAATTSVHYLETHIRSSSISLKVQTSKGNYLSDLVVRTESLDRKYSSGPGGAINDDGDGEDQEMIRAQTMDDFILRVAVFQLSNFNDRSAILGVNTSAPSSKFISSNGSATTTTCYEDQKKTAPKVMLLTFDRNLRLRARARGVDVADDKEMARILGSGGG